MRIGFSTGFAALDNYWGRWPWAPMMGGSELLTTELACELAAAGHDVTVRLPYELDANRCWRGVSWARASEPPLRGLDLVCAVDDYAPADSGARRVLLACRSDPPASDDYDELIFLSRTHAKLCGHPSRPVLGGGVRLSDYATPVKRIPRRVIYTSSPDRGGWHAEVIGRHFDFVETYRGAKERSRAELVQLQKSARALIHPLDPPRPSEFFCMAVLEALAAGTPAIVSDADALAELWGDVAIVLPRPIRYADWIDELERLMSPRTWARRSRASAAKAADYDWPLVAARFLKTATEA